jgi:uncharacterized RDD family membrane protein YckC
LLPRPESLALDTVRAVATPEGVELDLRLAGPVGRACAWLIDLFLRLTGMLVLWLVLIPLGQLGMGVWLILLFLVEWLYPVAFEIWAAGATPGKKLLGLRVVNDDGTPVSRWASVTRNLLRAVDFLPVLYGVGFTAMLLNRDFKRMGDLVAGTVVIYVEPARVPSAIPEAPPLAPRAPLTLEESRAVLEFAERVATLTPERAEELAGIPSRLTGTDDGALARRRLLQLANHVIGRRHP